VAQQDIAAKLAGVPLFSGCSKKELAVIARAAKEVTHKKGAVIAREGERVQTAMLTLSWSVIGSAARTQLTGRLRCTWPP